LGARRPDRRVPILWPCLLRIGSEKPLQVEEWTLTLTEVTPDMKQFRFTVAGSKTGADGEGMAGQRFVSKSGRVVIDPADWNFDYALKVFKKPIPADFSRCPGRSCLPGNQSV
jgi:hypothetical protein